MLPASLEPILIKLLQQQNKGVDLCSNDQLRFSCGCRDVQASSILLDDKFEVRLGSLNEVCTQEGEGHQNVITRILRLSQ